MNTANKCREMGLQIDDTIEKLDVCRSLWREANVKSIKPRDVQLYYSVLTESTDKYVKYYFKLLAEVGGM